mmetsp:Transcript_31745/g.42300  ORF Transcript_31745/g.42300 Transcript_31745/m.42300 type:complete len:80 (-) Transcript_31745:67-306(-)
MQWFYVIIAHNIFIKAHLLDLSSLENTHLMEREGACVHGGESKSTAPKIRNKYISFTTHAQFFLKSLCFFPILKKASLC